MSHTIYTRADKISKQSINNSSLNDLYTNKFEKLNVHILRNKPSQQMQFNQEASGKNKQQRIFC